MSIYDQLRKVVLNVRGVIDASIEASQTRSAILVNAIIESWEVERIKTQIRARLEEVKPVGITFVYSFDSRGAAAPSPPEPPPRTRFSAVVEEMMGEEEEEPKKLYIPPGVVVKEDAPTSEIPQIRLPTKPGESYMMFNDLRFKVDRFLLEEDQNTEYYGMTLRRVLRAWFRVEIPREICGKEVVFAIAVPNDVAIDRGVVSDHKVKYASSFDVKTEITIYLY